MLLAAIARAGEASPFDAVKDGVLTVYTIDELTFGQADAAEQIGKLIRDTNAVDGWTDPTIRGQATESTRPHFVVITIRTAADGGPAKQVTRLLPFGRTGAIALDSHRTRWLLFTPTLVLTQTKPA